MKAFDVCDRRCADRGCIQGGRACAPSMELDVGSCWRMAEENDMLLQCPKCKSGLWFDSYVTNPLGSGNEFFCPSCNENIDRSAAIQTMERLGKAIKEYDPAKMDE